MTTDIFNGEMRQPRNMKMADTGSQKVLQTRAWTRLSDRDGNGDTLVAINEHCLKRDLIIRGN